MNYLFLDPGSSGTKILSMVGFCAGYFVEPGANKIDPLTREDMEDEQWASYSFGEGIVEFSGEVWKVGYRPPMCHSAATKFSGAVAKAIASIASADCGRGGTFTLGVVLPCDEFSSRKEFAERVRAGIKKAVYNGKPVTATIAAIKVNPEGSGLVYGKPGNLAAVMVGHTDITIDRFDAGKVNLTQSVTFGGAGIGAIAKSIGVPGGDAYIAEALSKSDFEKLSACGIPAAHIQRAAEERKALYVRNELAPLIESYLWGNLDGFVLGGGGAKYLEKELTALIPIKRLRIQAPKGLKLFGKLDAARYADIYGMAYRSLKDEIEAKLSGDIPKSVDCEVVNA